MRIRLLLACVAITALTSAHGAGFINPPKIVPSMSAPQPSTPVNTIYRYDVVTPSVTFVWDQYPGFISATQLLPNNFVLCVVLPGDAPCSHASAVWTGLASGTPNVAIRSPTSTAIIGYRYSVVPTLPVRNLDVGQTWMVGGCTSMADSSCVFSAATWFVASTHDLEAFNIGGGLHLPFLEIEGIATNNGSRAVSKLDVRLETREVFYDGSILSCLVDPNSAALAGIPRSDLYAIDLHGSLTQFTGLPSDGHGGLLAPFGIRGIFRTGSFVQNSPLPGQSPISAALPAFNPPVPPPPPPMPPPAPTPHSLVTQDVRLEGNGSGHAFVSTLALDEPHVVVEYDSINNRRAECLPIN